MIELNRFVNPGEELVPVEARAGAGAGAGA